MTKAAFESFLVLHFHVLFARRQEAHLYVALVSLPAKINAIESISPLSFKRLSFARLIALHHVATMPVEVVTLVLFPILALFVIFHIWPIYQQVARGNN